MKRIAASLLAVGLLAASVLAAETTSPATAPAAPVTKATGTTTKAPDGAKVAPAKTEPKSVATARQVMECYRLRWQIELTFDNSTWCTPLDVMEFRGSIGLNRPLVGSLVASVRRRIDRRQRCAVSRVRPRRPASPATVSG